ncbi:MAG: nitrilase-related carbon-nitrogen hydrolase, partial [Pseudomonadota bacterium]
MDSALAEALPMAEAAVGAGAEMLFLPEYCGGLASDGVRFCPPAAQESEHPVLAAIRDFAAKRGVWVQVGSIAVEGPDDKIINRGY